MNQNIVCKFQNCSYRSKAGFCLNRLTVINEYGVCKRITKSGYNEQIKEPWMKNNWRDPDIDKELYAEEDILAIEEKTAGPSVQDLLASE